MQIVTRELKALGLAVTGFFVMFAASAWAAGSSDVSRAAPTPCITPAGAIYSVNCSSVSSAQSQSSSGSALGDTTTVPATAVTTAGTPVASPTPTASPSLTPGTMPTPVPTVTPASGSGSGLPDTGAVAVSSAIGLSAIGWAGWMYYKRRKLANELVLPRRVSSDPEMLDIAKLNS